MRRKMDGCPLSGTITGWGNVWWGRWESIENCEEELKRRGGITVLRERLQQFVVEFEDLLARLISVKWNQEGCSGEWFCTQIYIVIVLASAEILIDQIQLLNFEIYVKYCKQSTISKQRTILLFFSISPQRSTQLI